jgi:hypothetical protein
MEKVAISLSAMTSIWGWGGLRGPREVAKHESRIEWEKTVFEAAGVDTEVLQKYLSALFGIGSKYAAKEKIVACLMSFRKMVDAFEAGLAKPRQFSNATLTWTISGLLSSDLLTDEKREVLKDFLGNSMILKEIADVLNMRLAALCSWSWGSSVPIEQRLKIQGVYNIHMREDLLQAIFLQFIGIKWSVFFKEAFSHFRTAKGAWKSNREEIPSLAKKRLDYYLGDLDSSSSSPSSKSS